MASELKVVILCGGKGTRLREETEFRPKPLVEVGGYPILWHIMKLYAHQGFNDFVLCLGYKGDMIKQYFLNYQAMNNDFTISLGERRQITYHGAHNEQDFRVTLADTGHETMTGGRLARVRRYLDTPLFMFTYGDGVADINLRELVAFHKSHGRIATVTTVHPLSRFGVVDIEGDGVRRFVEKPRMESWTNAGFFVFDHRVFDYLEGGDACVFESEPMQKLASDGQMMAYRHDGFFFAMDTYREYLYLNELWSSGRAPWRIWT